MATGAPHEERWRNLLHVIVVGLAVSVLLALVQTTSIHLIRQTSLIGSAYPRPWSLTFALTLPSWLIIALATPGIVLVARRYSFESNRRLLSGAVHTAVSIVFALAHLAAMSLTYSLFATYKLFAETIRTVEFWPIFGITLRNLFFLEIGAYWSIVGIYLVLHHSNLRTQLAEARLEALRAQLNPHFLFNTLNAVSALAQKGEKEAVTEALAVLSDMLRAALEQRTPEVSLAREIELVDSYIAIQRIRYEDRLNINKSIAPNTLAALVPLMVLQPIVENAIEHSINARLGPVKLSIAANRGNGALLLEVCDNGPGFSTLESKKGLGLANTRARLDALYGIAHRFDYGTLPGGGAYVRISIPYHDRLG